MSRIIRSIKIGILGPVLAFIGYGLLAGLGILYFHWGVNYYNTVRPNCSSRGGWVDAVFMIYLLLMFLGGIILLGFAWSRFGRRGGQR